MSLTGLIFDIKRFSVNDGPGIRTTVFFKGCPLSCIWCHNPEGRNACTEQIVVSEMLDGKAYLRNENIGRFYSISEVMQEIEKEHIFHETSDGGVTFSGGEPLMQPDFLKELAAECRKKDIHTCLDTSGECDSRIFGKIIEAFDLVLFDVKMINQKKHIEWTGIGNITILDNLKILDQSEVNYILRIPLIPGVNIEKESTFNLLEFLKQLKFSGKEIHLLPYHAMAKHKMNRLGMEYPMDENLRVADEDLNRIYNSLMQSGYKVKIGG